MDSQVEQLKQSRIPIVRVRWNSRISSHFHQYVFRDQHKLNFGTKFLLEGKTVITHHFRSFPKVQKNTIHQTLFITTLFISLLFIIFGVSLTFREAFRNFTIHETLFIAKKISSFTCIIHFIVNLVYGYLNSRNRIGSGANSCIISKDISYGLEIVCISSVGHLHVIPLLGFSNLYI